MAYHDYQYDMFGMGVDPGQFQYQQYIPDVPQAPTPEALPPSPAPPAAPPQAPAAPPPPPPNPAANYSVGGTGTTPANPYHEAGRTYQQYAGWDTGKLNDPNHQTTKYNFMRTVQQLGIPANSPGVLNAVADYMRNHGYPGTQVVGRDKIDFGDGFGPIDVVVGSQTSNPSWGWGNVGASGAGAAAGVVMPPGSGPTMPQGGGSVPQVGAGGGDAPAAGGGNDLMNSFMDYINRSGMSEFGQGLQNMLLGALQGTDPNTNRRFENAVELANRARRSQINNMRGQLADRGLLSLPGQPQGMEAQGLGRIEEAIAPEFARAIRDISVAEGDRWQALMNMGLNTARQSEGNMLGALTGAGQYGLGLRGQDLEQQQFQANLALQYLQSDRNFQQFLAQQGLSIQQLQWEMMNGDRQYALAVIQQGLNAAGTGEGGSEPA